MIHPTPQLDTFYAAGCPGACGREGAMLLLELAGLVGLAAVVIVAAYTLALQNERWRQGK
jgi:hypothetical protein